jgi:hypothetical protein
MTWIDSASAAGTCQLAKIPTYVGTKGWVGIELDRLGDEELSSYILEAWKLVKPKRFAI